MIRCNHHTAFRKLVQQGSEIMVEFSVDYLNGRVEQLRRERESIRLAEIALAGRVHRRGLLAPVLASMGQGLETFGTRLRQRYADIPAEANTPARLDPRIQVQPGR